MYILGDVVTATCLTEPPLKIVRIEDLVYISAAFFLFPPFLCIKLLLIMITSTRIL